MTVQVKIDPTTGLTKCGNSIEKEDTCQLLFSTVHQNGPMHFGLGTPNVLYNAEQLISHSMTKKDVGLKDVCLDPHTYWAVDNRPVGTKQIIDSGLFTYLYGGKKNAPLKEVERFQNTTLNLLTIISRNIVLPTICPGLWNLTFMADSRWKTTAEFRRSSWIPAQTEISLVFGIVSGV